MARKARIKSNTGIYHVLVRAIADLPLFTDEEDIQIYTGILSDLQHQGRCEIFAYALFPTHVHLLIRAELNETAAGLRNEQSSTKQAEPYENESSSEAFRNEVFRSEAIRSASVSSEPIGSIMKRLASSYSYFFNVKYDHYGPIYQDRFKSNPVETQDYYLRVLHHIANQDTPWKYTTSTIPSGLLNLSPSRGSQEGAASGLLPSPPRGGQEGLLSPSRGSQEGAASGLLPSPSRGSKEGALLDFQPRKARITDSRLLTYLQTNYQFTTIPEFLQRSDEDIKATIQAAKKIGGSIRQITRLTGSPYQYVFQVK